MVAFDIGEYDSKLPLIIDPEIIYSTFLGGSDGDAIENIVIDSQNNIYVTGGTGSSNFPTASPYQTNLEGTGDSFVAKINSHGTELIYSTYFSGGNIARISVDDLGNAFIGGRSGNDLPKINGLHQATTKFHSYLAKYGPTGDLLFTSTFGGYGVADFALDSQNNIVVAGRANDDYPIQTKTPLQKDCNNCTSFFKSDVFVAKFNSIGDQVLFSTYFGGSGFDRVFGVALDSQDNIHITGETSSHDFPTINAYQPNKPEPGDWGRPEDYSYDVFVTKIKFDGSEVIYSTYFGGSDNEGGVEIAIDSQDNAVIFGLASQIIGSPTKFPTKNPIKGEPNWADNDIILFKLNSEGNDLIFSTFLGGSTPNAPDIATSMVLDINDNIYLTGYTGSTDFPLVDPIQASIADKTPYPDNRVRDAFVMLVNASGSEIVFSTYLGGSYWGTTDLKDYEAGNGIAVDAEGNIYIGGATYSDDFPTNDAFQPDFGGGRSDSFITKLDMSSLGEPQIKVNPDAGFFVDGETFNPNSKTYTLKNISTSTLDYSFSFSGTFHDSNTGTTVPSDWLTLVDSGAGTLAALEKTSITATVQSSLQQGSYEGTISFINDTNGKGDTDLNAQVAVNPVHLLTVTESPSGYPNPVGPSDLDSLSDSPGFEFLGGHHDSANGGLVKLNVDATDSLGHSLSYYWSASCTTLGDSGLFSNLNARDPTWLAPANLLGDQQQCTLSVQIGDNRSKSTTVSYSQGILGTSQDDRFSIAKSNERPACFSTVCNQSTITFAVTNDSTTTKTINVAGNQPWLNINPNPIVSDQPIAGDPPLTTDLASPQSSSVSVTLEPSQTATFSAKINSEIQKLFAKINRVEILVIDSGSSNIVGSFDVFMDLLENPLGQPRENMVVAPYWQAEGGIYTFVVASHPSLKDMSSQIGVKITPIQSDGAPFAQTHEFTISSGQSKKIFITSTNNALVNFDRYPDESFIVGLSGGQNGQLIIHPSAQNPNSISGAPGAPGRGFPDIRSLTFWGAIVVQGSATGFNMEFIGDMQDSRAFSSPNFSGVN